MNFTPEELEIIQTALTRYELDQRDFHKAVKDYEDKSIAEKANKTIDAAYNLRFKIERSCL